MTRRVAVLAALLASLARAAAAGGGPEADGAADSAARGPRPLWELGAGLAGLRLPDYRGSDQSHNYLLPVPYFVYRGTWLKADRDGARALLFHSDRVKVDVSLGAATPTRSEDNVARQGMPDLPAIGEIGPNLGLTLAGSLKHDRWRLDLRLPARAAVTLQRSPEYVGVIATPNLNLDLNLDNATGDWNLGLLTGPVFADRKYNEYQYGVDAVYATPTRPAYHASGGYAGWQALVSTSRRIGRLWAGAFLRYDSLRGAVFEDSPLVKRPSALTLGFGVAWVLATSSELVPSSD
jgi:MipA family protein